MDVVYVVKPGDDNDELRYSLRSLANLPHGRVWIAGHKPSWVNDVGFISVAQNRTKWQNSTDNLWAACEHPEVSDEFVYMNDDIFIVEPLDAVPVLHRGPVDKVAEYYRRRRSTGYLQGMLTTKRILGLVGSHDPLSYELHVPLVVNKQAMAEVLALPKLLDVHTKCLHKRTLYGNYWKLGGDEVEDCKVYDRTGRMPDGPFVSTTDQTFGYHPVGVLIRERFPEPSPHEREDVARVA